jgi:hypothetical protein
VVALDVAGAVGAVEGLEVEAADLASQPAVALSDLLLLAPDEPAVALPDPVAPVEDAAFLGLILAILRSQGDIRLVDCARQAARLGSVPRASVGWLGDILSPGEG